MQWIKRLKKMSLVQEAKLPNLLLLFSLLSISVALLSACAPNPDKVNRIDNDSASQVTLVPTVTAIAEPLYKPTTTTSAVTENLLSTSEDSPTPSATPSVQQIDTPTVTVANYTDLGRLYFARPDLYGWYELQVRSDLNSLVLRQGNDGEYGRHTSRELSVEGPGRSTLVVFSHFSDQIAFWSTEPSELWLSDAAYVTPQLILADTENVYVPENEPFPEAQLTLAWSSDDQHLFIYSKQNPELNRVVDTASGAIDNWYWTCSKLVLSPRSERLATLCESLADVAAPHAYAIVEWGGDIWYADRLPGESWLDCDGDFECWRWSADGEALAFYNPSDPNGYLQLSDSTGAVRELQPGTSLYRQTQLPRGGLQFEYFTETPFHWAKSGRELLFYGFGQPERPCPPYRDELFESGDLFEWPCWQALDVETGEVIWSEADLLPSLSANFDEKIGSEPIQLILPMREGLAAARVVSSALSDKLIIFDMTTNDIVVIDPYPNYRNIYWAEG